MKLALAPKPERGSKIKYSKAGEWAGGEVHTGTPLMTAAFTVRPRSTTAYGGFDDLSMTANRRKLVTE